MGEGVKFPERIKTWPQLVISQKTSCCFGEAANTNFAADDYSRAYTEYF